MDLRTVDKQTCDDFHEINKPTDYDPPLYHKGIFCAGGEAGKDACGGDSGSAVLTKNFSEQKVVQVGLVSGSLIVGECGLKDAYGYYTRVAYYLKWILDNMSD